MANGCTKHAEPVENDMDECECGGACEECKAKAVANVSDADADAILNAGKYGNPQCGDSGRYLSHGSGTGKGEAHKAAKSGFNPQTAAEEGNDTDEDFIDPDRPSLLENADMILGNGSDGPTINAEASDEEFVRQLVCNQATEQKNQGDHTGSPAFNREEPDMALTEGKRAELIQWITVNCDCWKGDNDVETLNEFTDGKLIDIAKAGDKSRKLELALNAAAKPIKVGRASVAFDPDKGRYVVNGPKGMVPGQATAPVAPAADEGMAEEETDEELYAEDGTPVKKKAPPMVGNARRAVNLAEWFLMAPAEAGADPEAVWNAAVIGEKRKRAEMIGVLTEHLDGERRTFAANSLQKKSMSDLELAILLKGPRVPQFAPQQSAFGHERAPVANYEGAAGGPPIYNNGPDDSEPIPMPSAIDSAIAFNQQQHKSKYRAAPLEAAEDAA